MAMITLRRKTLISLPFLTSLYSSSSSSKCKQKPYSLPPLIKTPTPKKIPFSLSAHGRTWVDPYHWMSNTDNADLINHLHSENSYADAFMADTGTLRRSLVAEMTARMPAKIVTPPESWGDWLYYQYIPEGKEYPILCRRPKIQRSFAAVLNALKGSGEEKILLDWNEIAENFGYVHIGTCRISPDHKYLAYTLDRSGSEMFVLQVKDLQTGLIISNSRVEGVISLAWAKDSSCLLYTVCDESLRPYRVFCTNLASNVSDDLLFTENDINCCVDITNTKDGKFITINSNSRASSEEENLKDGLWPVRKRVPGVQYFLEHHYGFFYILNNSPIGNMGSVSKGYHIAKCRAEKSLLSSWQRELWQRRFLEEVERHAILCRGSLQEQKLKQRHDFRITVVLPDEDISFHDMDMFHENLVLTVQKKGLPLFCSINMPIDAEHEKATGVEEFNPWFFPVPPSLCNIAPGSNNDFMSSIYRVLISSPVMPDVMVDYDMANRKFTILHQEEVVGLHSGVTAKFHAKNYNFNISRIPFHDDKHLQSVEDSQTWHDLSEAFSCERKEVLSHDGVKVPLTILYSKNTQFTGQSPGILHGYGAYGEVLDKSWSSDLICLLSRGWVFAYADVRGGGGDLSWHQAGSGLHKLNSMHDFAACGSYLISEGYVNKNQLCAIGTSAGGLLVGASINMYPDLFCAAVLKVPFLDICNTMLDPTLPLTTLDYEEFGDPARQSDFDNIRSYSPYDNIPLKVCYPSVLVTASFYDSRVGVWEAAKWVARVREITCPTCSRSVILKTNMSGGHFGEGGRFQHCEETAFEYAFLIKAIERVCDQFAKEKKKDQEKIARDSF